MNLSFLVLLLFSISELSQSQKTPIMSLIPNEPDDIIEIIPPEERFDSICDDKLSTVDLSRTGIKDLSPRNFNSPRIKCLNLEGNGLTNLPHEIFESDNLANLTYLNLANNTINLKHFPSPNGHANLKTLVLDGNEGLNIRSFSFGSLPNLKYLHLRKIHPSDKINFGILSPNFQHLTHLYLTDNEIEISDYFKNPLRSVTHLHLERNNLAVRIPDDLSPAGNLTNLYLDGIKIDILEVLKLGLHMPQIKVLSLRNCQLKSIDLGPLLGFMPASFTFRNLTTIDFSSNQISSFKETRAPNLLLKNVQNLSLSHNLLTDVPAGIESRTLRILSLTYNKIDRIRSKPFKNCTNLRILSLRGNRIYQIDPDTFSFLVNLETLDLAENRLSFLPPMWTQRLNNLRYLNVNSNNFTSVAALSIPLDHKLGHLHLRNNKIANITSTMLLTAPKTSTLHIYPIP